MAPKSVCLIAGNIGVHTCRLQPWRYLIETASQLAGLGHPVSLLTDGDQDLPPDLLQTGVNVRQLPSVRNPAWKTNRILREQLEQINPQALIWHLGRTSFLYQVVPGGLNMPIVGVFSNPIYRPQELARIGLKKLIKGHYISGVHVVGSLAPDWLLRILVPKTVITSLIVQTQTTRDQLRRAGLWRNSIQVIPPGVDPIWTAYDNHDRAAVRSAWGFAPEDCILLYYGSPAELRGLPTLIRALHAARQSRKNLKLVTLCRGRDAEWDQEGKALKDLIHVHQLEPFVKVINGFLEPADLVRFVAAADIIVLPFELVPSDAPLSILESQALGKPVVTTRVACLPELAAQGKGYLAEPGSPASLAAAIAQAADQFAGRPETPLPGRPPARSWQAVGREWSQLLQGL